MAVLPVRIAPSAFGDARPARALFLSPDHAVLVGDVLIPVKHLINGTTVSRARPVEVTYYHLELSTHDVPLAEGLPVETFLDPGVRTAFANGGSVLTLHPGFVASTREALGCAPLVVSGVKLDEARARLMARSMAAARSVQKLA